MILKTWFWGIFRAKTKPTGFADLKPKKRAKSLKGFDPQNAGSRLHPNLWDFSSATSKTNRSLIWQVLKTKKTPNFDT